MNPAAILDFLWAQGFAVDLGQDDRLLVSPASTLHDSQREILRANKSAIVALLKEERQVTADLLAAAMRVCDRHDDGEEAREEMRRDCLALHIVLQRDLLEHFRGRPQP
ncbi:hypothetical protein [Variovorax soli]|uniref:TubC N-terminal docking domain-containing protein n=1 Tax=Variovorax soli TaxID=376815 RepID=A0ABU1NAW3_9BURK|nr:hypothetical protein [Variovorax soli]MDR6535592.1 hypothetical protein [Variovorax soli]